jgi:hypothetical protein
MVTRTTGITETGITRNPNDELSGACLAFIALRVCPQTEVCEEHYQMRVSEGAKNQVCWPHC